jgi:iron complex transport system substrate-binding protein
MPSGWTSRRWRHWGPTWCSAWRGGNPDHLLEQLEQRGYRVVAPWRRKSLDDVARAAGRNRPAGRHARNRRARPRRAIAPGSSRSGARRPASAELRVFWQVSWRPLYTVGGGQMISEVIALCGGRNIFRGTRRAGPGGGRGSGDRARPRGDPDGGSAARRARTEWRRWPGVAAVARGHLYAVDGDLVVRAAPRILEGTRARCARRWTGDGGSVGIRRNRFSRRGAEARRKMRG